MLNLAYRNCKVFFRDRSAVLYSFMAVFIIIGLYVLFLGEAMRPKDLPEARFLMDSWIMAGVIAAGTFTTTLGALGQTVEDGQRKISKDFHSSPLRRAEITGGYMIGSIVIGMFLSIVTFVLAEGYILMNGGVLLTLQSALSVLGVILLSVLASSAMMFFVITFVHSTRSFAGLSTILGTLIGFITGIYLPIGELPASIQTVVKVFPISHAAVLLRGLFMEQALESSFAGAPAAVRAEFEKDIGAVFTWGSFTMEAWLHVLALVLTIVVFYGLSVLRVSRKRSLSV